MLSSSRTYHHYHYRLGLIQRVSLCLIIILPMMLHRHLAPAAASSSNPGHKVIGRFTITPFVGIPNTIITSLDERNQQEHSQGHNKNHGMLSNNGDLMTKLQSKDQKAAVALQESEPRPSSSSSKVGRFLTKSIIESDEEKFDSTKTVATPLIVVEELEPTTLRLQVFGGKVSKVLSKERLENGDTLYNDKYVVSKEATASHGGTGYTVKATGLEGKSACVSNYSRCNHLYDVLCVYVCVSTVYSSKPPFLGLESLLTIFPAVKDRAQEWVSREFWH